MSDRDPYAPGMPYLEVVIGDTNIEAIPQFLEHFSHNVFAQQLAGMASFTFFDATYDTLENLILKNSSDVKFRYGWRDGPISPWHQGVVYEYRSRFSEQGLHLDVHVADMLTFYGAVKYDTLWAYTQGDPINRISDIVVRLAARMGLKTTEQSVVRTRPGPLSLFQQNMSDAEFITYVLLPLAVSEAGYANYHFFVVGDTLYFQPRQGQTTARTFVFGAGQDSKVISFASQYNGLRMLHMGGGDLTTTGYNPLTGKLLRRRIDLPETERPGLVPTPADFIATGQFGETTPDPQTPYVGGRIYHLPFSTQQEIDSWCNWKWTQSREGGWEAALSILGDPQLAPNDLVEVQVVKRTDQTLHYTSGNYFVRDVEQQIRHGSFITNLKLIAQGASLGTTELGGTAPAAEPSTATPANMESVQSSLIDDI